MKYIFFFLPFLFFISCGDSNSTNSSTKQDLDSLLSIYPDSVPLLVQRGNQYLETYKFKKALADGAKAFRLDSTNLDARLLYADILNNRPDRTDADVMIAQTHLIYIAKKQPKNTKALVSLAATYTQQMDFENSFKYINAALKINPKYRDGYVLKGKNYLILNNVSPEEDKSNYFKLAISSYQTAVQEDPKFYEAYLMLGSLYESQNDTVLCLEYYKTAAQLQPKNTDVLYALAYANQKFNNVNKAKYLYRKMIELDTTYSQALFQLGYIKQWQEVQPDLDSAIYFYRSTIETTPKYVQAWHNLGICYLNRGKEGDKIMAQKSFQKAVKFDPNFALSREMLEKFW